MSMIDVGITNISDDDFSELRKNQPAGISFSRLCRGDHAFFSGFDYIQHPGCDVVESRGACVCEHKHIQHLNSVIFDFELFGDGFERMKRLELWKRMVRMPSCRKIVFSSKAGFGSMTGDYGNVKDKDILSKSCVVYPAFSYIPDFRKREGGKVNILFASDSFYGDFAEQVVDTFISLEKKYDITLNILTKDIDTCYPKMLFHSTHHNNVMKKISGHDNIFFYPSLEKKGVLDGFLKKADIFVRPPMKDHYAFYLVRPMMYGLPVVTSDFFSIKEIVEDSRQGFLVDLSDKYYLYYEDGAHWYVSKKLGDHVRMQLYDKLKLLIDDKQLRQRFGVNARKKAEFFSFGRRNKLMKAVYEEAVGR